MLRAARAAKIPVLVGSACTAGIDAQLDRLAGIARDIAREDKAAVQVAIINCDAANAIKITIPRPTISGDVDDTDVFGGQQHGPLVDVEVP